MKDYYTEITDDLLSIIDDETTLTTVSSLRDDNGNATKYLFLQPTRDRLNKLRTLLEDNRVEFRRNGTEQEKAYLLPLISKVQTIFKKICDICMIIKKDSQPKVLPIGNGDAMILDAKIDANVVAGLFIECGYWLRGTKYGNRQIEKRIDDRLRKPEAKKYFDKAIELGLMDSNYEWKKGLQMLACFAREMSITLKMGKGDKISWQPFEILFNIEKGKLRQNYNDIQKTGQAPSEVDLIDKVFSAP